MHPDLTIAETEKEIIGEFALFDSWDDKYEYIIDLGKGETDANTRQMKTGYERRLRFGWWRFPRWQNILSGR
jgi:sulfur transfer protein SufE